MTSALGASCALLPDVLTTQTGATLHSAFETMQKRAVKLMPARPRKNWLDYFFLPYIAAGGAGLPVVGAGVGGPLRLSCGTVTVTVPVVLLPAASVVAIVTV